MSKVRLGSAEFSQPTKPDPLEMVGSDGDLFDLASEEDIKPDSSIVPLVHVLEPHISEAWEDIGKHEPFVAPADEGQVLAIERQTPNPITDRAAHRIELDHRLGLAGIINRTPDQDEQLRRASQQGHDAIEQGLIDKGMSPAEAHARILIIDLRMRQRF